MKGLWWCVWLTAIGVPLTLLGLAVDAPRLIVWGAGAIATVVVGWPVLVLMGAVDELTPRRRGK